MLATVCPNDRKGSISILCPAVAIVKLPIPLSNWSRTNSSLETPDLRFFENQFNTETELYTIPASNVQRPFHFWRDLEDTQMDYKLDLTFPLTSSGYKLKVGGLITNKERAFNEFRYQIE